MKGYSIYMEVVKFNELEEKVKSIIEEYAELKKKNQELEGLLKSREGDLEAAKNKVSDLSEERDAVRGKVDSLLDMLNNIPV